MSDQDYSSAFLRSLLPMVVAFWPLWLLIGLLFASKIVVEIYRVIRFAKSGIYEIDKLRGPDFESYVGFLFRKLGYQVQQTAIHGDFGADLVVAKGGRRMVIQAKRYRERVGVKAVQEVVAAKSWYSCSEAMVITNSTFTQQAIKLARRNKVLLWNRTHLVRAMLSIGGKRTAVAVAHAGECDPLSGDDSKTIANSDFRAICLICGRPVSDKMLNYCIVHREQLGGRVLCWEHQRMSERMRRSAS